MSFSDDDDDLPLPKKQRIYYGSLEEKLKDIVSGGGGKRSANGDDGGDNLNGDEDSDKFSNDSENEDNDAIAQAVKAGNINISEGESVVNFLQ